MARNAVEYAMATYAKLPRAQTLNSPCQMEERVGGVHSTGYLESVIAFWKHKDFYSGGVVLESFVGPGILYQSPPCPAAL